MSNLFRDPGLAPDGEERFEALLRGPDGLLVERIVSHGQVTPEGAWFDQDLDEWVLVLEGEAVLGFEDGSSVRLARGDWHFLPRAKRHRVDHTSTPCIWLAVHGDLRRG